MSELKFRAWDIDWHRFEYFEIGENGDRYGIFRVAANKFGSIVEQYTGLKDKSGKEIYEGDIVKASDCVREVVYKNDEGAYMFVNFTLEDQLSRELFYSANSKYEVVGNIHENPELLEEEK